MEKCVYNPNSNYGESAKIRNQAGLNSLKANVKNIAIEFAMWISPEFKIYIAKEY